MGKLPFENNHRKLIVRKEAETSDKYGVYPDKRTMEQYLNLGIINIDPPRKS